MAETTEQPTAAKPWYRRWWGILLIVLGVLTVIAIVTPGADDNGDDPQPAADDGEDVAVDDPDGSDEEAEPEAEPVDEGEPEGEDDTDQPQAAVEVFTAEGSGDDVIDVPVVDDGQAVISFTHDGSGNFSVTAYDDAGDMLDLLVNVIGGYEGTRPYNLGRSSPAELEISADGPWSATVSDLAEQPVFDGAAQGSGDQVLVQQVDGRLAVTHDGDGNFAVWSHGDLFPDMLVNEIGAYEGTVRLGSGDAIEISADGSWTLELD